MSLVYRCKRLDTWTTGTLQVKLEVMQVKETYCKGEISRRAPNVLLIMPLPFERNVWPGYSFNVAKERRKGTEPSQARVQVLHIRLNVCVMRQA